MMGGEMEKEEWVMEGEEVHLTLSLPPSRSLSPSLCTSLSKENIPLVTSH